MKKKLRTWLLGVRSGYPAAFSPYWHVVPLGRMRTFLAGYFFIGAAGGFALDLLQLNASRVGGGFFWPVLVGTGATALRAAASLPSSWDMRRQALSQKSAPALLNSSVATALPSTRLSTAANASTVAKAR